MNYTKSQPYRRTLIVRFKVSSTNPDSADRSSSKILMEIPQPYSNHNGGQVAFGPDGYLYIALGDGGSGGDPQNNAQNKSSLLGKLLRIDVDQTTRSTKLCYSTDNPFNNNTQGFKEEIYAYGLRNPWRFSFDFPTGRLWCADVGQNAWEEIDLIVNGGNYGWRCYEGNHDYDLSGCSETKLHPANLGIFPSRRQLNYRWICLQRFEHPGTLWKIHLCRFCYSKNLGINL